MTVRAARRALTVRGARMLGGTTAPANGRRGAGLACCQEDLFHYIFSMNFRTGNEMHLG